VEAAEGDAVDVGEEGVEAGAVEGGLGAGAQAPAVALAPQPELPVLPEAGMKQPARDADLLCALGRGVWVGRAEGAGHGREAERVREKLQQRGRALGALPAQPQLPRLAPPPRPHLQRRRLPRSVGREPPPLLLLRLHLLPARLQHGDRRSPSLQHPSPPHVRKSTQILSPQLPHRKATNLHPRTLGFAVDGLLNFFLFHFFLGDFLS
jgi:hypothetical protein